MQTLKQVKVTTIVEHTDIKSVKGCFVPVK